MFDNLNSKQPKAEVSLPVAVVIFTVFICGFVAVVCRNQLVALEQWLTANNFAITVNASAALINILCLGLLVLGEKRRGKYLRAFTKGSAAAPNVRFDLPVKRLAVAAGVAYLAYMLDGWAGVTSPLWVTDLPLNLDLAGARPWLSANFALAAFSAAFWISKSFAVLSKVKVWGKLPEPPPAANRLILGCDETDKHSPAWVSMGTKALSGNILITGSIGTGKTQGAMLPYLDQLLTNFSPRPAMLVIDPKRSMIGEALAIIRSRGLEDECLHLTLGGKVRYNPVYHPQALSGGRCAVIAQMLRAAAVNTLGKSDDAAFWDTSASTLIKNALVYCAGRHSYYTLNDLYTALTEGAQGKLNPGFEEALKRTELTAEERFNVLQAQTYFAMEFSKFEDRLKTGILASATAFLNQFKDFQTSQIFCPTKEEITLSSMDEAVDDGKIILLDIANEALAKAVGTVIKLQFEASLLERTKNPNRPKAHAGILIIDEYQDVVTSGHGVALGDESFLAKGREANSVTIAATQSLTSLENALGREKAARELTQNFRTRIACATVDLPTIKSFQEVAGEVERDRVSRSLSESLQDVQAGLFGGGEVGRATNVSESVSIGKQKEYRVSASEFAGLKMFECFAHVSTWVGSEFRRLSLKPYFLEDKRLPQAKLLAKIAGSLVLALLSNGYATAGTASDVPNVCSVVETLDFEACTEVTVSGCTCPGLPPHPCALISYYRPETFIEVHPNAGASFFASLPGAKSQLAGVAPQGAVPFGAEGEIDSHAFEAHVIDVPLASLIGNFLPCGGGSTGRPCFAAMSEHLGALWASGAADSSQPSFLAWSAAPKACIAGGAAQSITGGGADFGASPGSPICSVRLDGLPKFPPSTHAACTGWGLFFPRTGNYDGPSQTLAAMMVAARIKSLAAEVFQAIPNSPDEKWELIKPQSSACFREGQNAGFLETAGRVTEAGRLAGGPITGYLVAIWRRVSCCREFPEAAALTGELAALTASCAGGKSGWSL